MDTGSTSPTLRGRTVALGAIVALVVACSGGGGDGAPTPIAGPADEPNVTLEDDLPEGGPAAPDEGSSADPYAVPDEITVDYVQTVLDELLPLWTDTEAEALDQAPLDEAPTDLRGASRAIRSPDESALYLISLEPVLRDVAEAERRRADLRTPQWQATEVAHGTDDCIVVDFDYPPGAAAESGRQVLLSKADERDPAGINPTPWVLDRGGPLGVDVFDDLAEVIERCDAERIVTQDADGDDDQ